MNTTWIVLANAARARICSLAAKDRALTEMVDLVHPASRSKGIELANARAGHVEKGYGGGGRGSTQLTPRTDPRNKEHQEFAREVAAYLEAALQQRRFQTWVLFASNPFLGELKSHLSEAVGRALSQSIDTDLSSLEGAELTNRVRATLTPPV